MIESRQQALAALSRAWPQIVVESRQILAGELHYQAMTYFALRDTGQVPLRQLGMNVKQWITDVQSELFRTLDARKHEQYRGGFEPIPDAVIFHPDANGSWQRRSRERTLMQMLLAIEIKASERSQSRLSRREILHDTAKLAAHRQEVQFRGSDFAPVMMVIDVTALENERMRPADIEACREHARLKSVSFLYVSPNSEIGDIAEI